MTFRFPDNVFVLYKIRVRVRVEVSVGGNTFKYVFGQTFI